MLEEVIKITGTIGAKEKIQGYISDKEELSATVTIPDTIGERHYEGVYELTPSFDDQTLETKGLVMDDDVTVDAIQVSRTSNPFGGTTVYIGGLING